LSGSQAGRERFERGCVRTPGAGPRDRNWATLRRTPEGSCVFLSAERLCSVQVGHGAAALPAVCAGYPRLVTRTGDRLALTDTLSCPEAARLCLLAEDSCALEPADPASLGRFLVRHVAAGGHDPLVRNFLPVRDAFLDLLRRSSYPVPSRLGFALLLAQRLDAVRGAGRAGATDRAVRDTIREGLSPATLERLHRECRAVVAPGVVPFILVQQILLVMLRRRHSRRLAELVRAVYAPFPGDADDGGGPDDGGTVRGRELSAAYQGVRRAWDSAYCERIARYLANYVANLWLQEPFTVSPDLATHVLGHMARVATVRFLLFMHPALRELGAPSAADPRHAGALDRAVVEVVYLFSRAMEHGQGMGGLPQGIVAEHRVRGRRRTLELATF